jgi:hypothetical protein
MVRMRCSVRPLGGWPVVRAAAATSLIVAARALGQGAPEPPAHERVAPTSTPGNTREPWANVGAPERATLDRMLRSSDWAFRALALMRLERYEGGDVNTMIASSLADESSWQVRSFAIRSAHSHGLAIDAARYALEADARVIRTAIQHGVAVPDEVVDRIALEMLNTKTVDALLIGIEIAAASDDDKIRRNAGKRTLTLIRNMDASVGAVVARRLAAAVQLDPAPSNLLQWRAWVSAQSDDYQLPRPAPPPIPDPRVSLIAQADEETFIRLRDYLGSLRQRDLEMVICLDATNSMTPVIDAVKADVDGLILFLSDISQTLRLGLLAYRDHDNPGKLIEAHPFTTDLASLRNFLFGLSTPGGATYPEAVLDAINACRQYPWREESERQIILIGDAPPHEKDESDLRRLLDFFRQQGFFVHAVHVPMEHPPGALERMTAPQAQQQELWRQEYNLSTQRVFQEIANYGGGRLVELDTSSRSELVRSVMKLTIDREWHPYFDEFYDAYLALCR